MIALLTIFLHFTHPRSSHPLAPCTSIVRTLDPWWSMSLQVIWWPIISRHLCAEGWPRLWPHNPTFPTNPLSTAFSPHLRAVARFHAHTRTHTSIQRFCTHYQLFHCVSSLYPISFTAFWEVLAFWLAFLIISMAEGSSGAATTAATVENQGNADLSCPTHY